MIADIRPSSLRGTMLPPPSKSVFLRALLGAALCEEETHVHLGSGAPYAEDITHAAEAVRALGASVTEVSDGFLVRGGTLCPPTLFSVGENASLFRFLVPILLQNEPNFRLLAEGSLPRRLEKDDLYINNYWQYNQETEDGVWSVRGQPLPDVLRFPASFGSQYVSGLLFALPRKKTDTTLILCGKIVSGPYVEMTRRVLSLFGIVSEKTDDKTLLIPGNQTYISPKDVYVEPDASAAAVAAALPYFGMDVRTAEGARMPLQGDGVFEKQYTPDAFTDEEQTVDVSDTPDLFPVYAVLAAQRGGATFHGTERLRTKESDRVQAMQTLLTAFGAEVDVGLDRVTVRGGRLHAPNGLFCGAEDHRIVMAATLLSLVYGGRVTGAEHVAKSYPSFFNDLIALGADITLS